MSTKTMSYFRNLVIIENFFCISRPHFIEDRKIRLICDAIFITVIIVITSIIIMDLITVNLTVGCRIFEIIICIELFGLAVGSRFQKSIINPIERLDEKCEEDEDFGSKIQAKIIQMILIFLPSLVIDYVGLTMLGVNNGFAIFLCVAFAAHDAEMTFVSLVIEAVNMRLEKLKGALPNVGLKVYRHVLIATAHISEQSTIRLLLMLAVTLITTVAYEFILVIADTEKIIYLSLYLIWRESRSMYSLWMMCSAVARTDSICRKLALYLAGRLIQDQSISKEKNPNQYKTVQRWYSVVISQRPQYISNSIVSVGLVTPILVLDLSINYMLIIVQMYLAYK